MPAAIAAGLTELCARLQASPDIAVNVQVVQRVVRSLQAASKTLYAAGGAPAAQQPA